MMSPVRACLLTFIALIAVSARAADDAGIQRLVFLGPTRPVFIELTVTIDGRPFRQVWQQRFDELFKLEDRDGDNQLDLEEAAFVVRAMNGSLAGKDPKELRKIATGARVDRQTLADFLKRELPPFALRSRAVIGQGSALALFPLLDTNADQRLSADELAVAEAQLMQRDFDDNGVITPGELILDPNAIAAASDPNAADKDLNPNESVIVLLDDSTSPGQFAERLLKHYDRNRDGKLQTVAPNLEISLPAPVMRAADKNSDRELDAAEVGALVNEPPDLQLQFALGEAGRASRARQGRQADSEFRVRQKLNGGYELKLGEAEVNFNRNNRDPQQDLVDFRSFDRDNNEYLDSAEAGANNIGTDAFKAMDSDGDGKVTKGELSSFMTEQNEAAAGRVQLIVRDLGQDLFGILDADLDGLLSPRELRQARTVLEIQDKNGDGMLGGDEVPQRLEFEIVRGADDGRQTEARMPRRVSRATTQAETTGPTWFRKMDRNNDGDLSPSEFVGPRAAFDKLDADGDGLVDRTEAEAAGP